MTPKTQFQKVIDSRLSVLLTGIRAGYFLFLLLFVFFSFPSARIFPSLLHDILKREMNFGRTTHTVLQETKAEF